MYIYFTSLVRLFLNIFLMLLEIDFLNLLFGLFIVGVYNFVHKNTTGLCVLILGLENLLNLFITSYKFFFVCAFFIVFYFQ